MRVVVLGAGYVGSVSAACLVRLGHSVIAVDPAPAKVEALNRGVSPVVEAGLDDMIAAAVRSQQLRALPSVGRELEQADVALVCVPTPSGTGGDVDLRPMRRVLQEMVDAAVGRETPLPVAVRSTILGGSLRQLLREVAPAPHPLRLVINPEFLRETSAIRDFFEPPYIVAGGDDLEAVERVLAIYDGIEAPRFRVDMETASLVKYGSNAFHALKIAFANEIATVSALQGADPMRVLELIKADRILNVSPAYLRPGFAFGGSCLPKDLRALLAAGRVAHEPLPLLSSILTSNQRRIDQALEMLLVRRPCRLAVLGLTFKAGTDDLRESPYVELVERLLGKGFELSIYDPDLDPDKLMGANRLYIEDRLPHLGRLLVGSPGEALDGARGVVLCKRALADGDLLALVRSGIEIYDLEYHTHAWPSPRRCVRFLLQGPSGS